MQTRPFLIHALSPLHAGTGDAADIIDLPIARMKATGIPFVPGSSIKGVLREHWRERRRDANGKLEAVFGPPSTDAALHAGALVVSDARLWALPVRSFRGVFAWVTSPLLLSLARRDLGTDVPVISLGSGKAATPAGSICVHGQKIYLEDLDLDASESSEASQWANCLAPLASPGQDIFTKRFVIADDETMALLWQTATQVDARVRIDEEKRTVAPGALWLEESLPSETLLIGLLAAERSRRNGTSMSPQEVLTFALPNELPLQFGGKATTGRGRCRLLPIEGPIYGAN
jgi:CRISPR-associated protein Cmr4